MPEPPTTALATRNDVIVSRVQAPRPQPQAHGSSFSRNDILVALFKHKRKIILATIAGLGAAAAVYFFLPPIYESDAKLLVRYVVERSSVDQMAENARGSSGLGRDMPVVLGSEMEILNSWDLAVQVAEAIGPKRLLPKSKGVPSKEAAAQRVAGGLTATVPKNSNIIFVSYQSADPELATLVLSELVNRYFTRHLEVHRSAGAFDFVTQQTDQVRARLTQTEDALKELKGKVGITSLDNGTSALNNEVTRADELFQAAEAELAEQQARVQQITGAVTGTKKSAKNAQASPGSAGQSDAAPDSAVQQYQVLVSRLSKLRQTNLELLAKYTAGNQMVKANQAELDEVEKQSQALEKKYPDLPTRVAPIGASKNERLDPASEAARLAGLQAKKDSLEARLHEVRERSQQLSQLRPRIADLERQQQLEETNYKYFQATLEKARVDEALDPSKIPNISAVQRPSPPMLVTGKRNKIALALAGAGLVLGIAFALLKELVLNQTIRRPAEIEKFVGINPLMAIPYHSKRQKSSGSKRNGKKELVVPQSAPGKNLAPWDAGHFIRAYSEAIRDRIGLYFELKQLTHKPKLVGLTGFSEGAGISTLAAGLAAALSETGDGKVLLVDVNLGPEEVHPFFRGRPAYSLKTALQPASALTSAADNLYLATAGAPNMGPAQLGLKKFFDLMPNLKASDFDYIIFDMPPLSQTSPTIGMAGFMDKLLLVVEAEETNRETVRRGYSSLSNTRNNVSIVLNKTRSFVPKWADGEL